MECMFSFSVNKHQKPILELSVCNKYEYELASNFIYLLIFVLFAIFYELIYFFIIIELKRFFRSVALYSVGLARTCMFVLPFFLKKEITLI